MDPATEKAIGSKIGYIKAILARGGSSEIVKYDLIPSLKNFAITVNSIQTPVVKSCTNAISSEL